VRKYVDGIHPGDPIDKKLCDLPPEELSDVPVARGSLRAKPWVNYASITRSY
jgi:hypothetical protein